MDNYHDLYVDFYGEKGKSFCSPSSHKFIRKILATHFYWECAVCGYSPELDYNKKEFKECHKEYLNWLSTKKKKISF